MDYIQEMQYANFLIGQIEESTKMQSYINECLAISEGTDLFNKLVSIQEAQKGAIADAWHKFLDMIKKIWEKFVVNLNKLTASDKKYLEGYKDVILKKPLQLEGTCNAYNQGILLLTQKTIPKLNYQAQKAQLSDDTAICKFFISEYTNPDIPFADFCKTFFLGGDKELPLKQVFANMTDMYNFCHDFEKVQKVIEQDKINVETACNDALRLLTAEETKINQAQKNAGQQQADQTASNTQTANTGNHVNVDNLDKKLTPDGKNEAFSFFDYNYTYSSVLEAYVNEDLNLQGSNQAAVASNNTAANNMSATSKNSQVNSKDMVDGANADNIKDMQDQLERYRLCASTELSAKLSAASVMYKDIMKVLTAHIKSYGGEINKPTNKVAANGTDYSNDRPAPEEGNDQQQNGKSPLRQ